MSLSLTPRKEPATDPTPAAVAAATQAAPTRTMIKSLAHWGLTGTVVPTREKTAKTRQRIEATKLFNVPWTISEAALSALTAQFVADRRRAYDDGYDDDEDDDTDFPYLLTEEGVACIPITGPLCKTSYWRTTYGAITAMAAHALANPAAKAILLCCDSPGGEVSGMFECADFLKSIRGQKPIGAISDDDCYSACFALATTGEKIFVTRTGGTGSVGCWQAHVDISKMLENDGVKITLISAGDKKVDGNAYEPLSKRAEADMQTECDRIRDMFVQLVASNRAVSADAVYATEAGIYMAEAGIPLFADALGTAQDAVAYLAGRIVASRENPETPDQPTEDLSTFTVAGRTYRKISLAVENAPEAEALTLLETIGCGTIQQEFQRISASPNPAERWADFSRGEGTPSLALRCSGLKASVGSEADSRMITCCVAPYNQLSADLGGFKEVYQPGCFKLSLAAGDDARCLFNHDSNMVLGRRSARTARFFETADGLYFQTEAPNTQWASDLLTSMRRGDIDGGSAAFFIVKQRPENRASGKVRVIEEARLVEGSVASFPIYETSNAIVESETTAAAAENQPETVASEEVVAFEAHTSIARMRLELAKLA